MRRGLATTVAASIVVLVGGRALAECWDAGSVEAQYVPGQNCRWVITYTDSNFNQVTVEGDDDLYEGWNRISSRRKTKAEVIEDYNDDQPAESWYSDKKPGAINPSSVTSVKWCCDPPKGGLFGAFHVLENESNQSKLAQIRKEDPRISSAFARALLTEHAKATGKKPQDIKVAYAHVIHAGVTRLVDLIALARRSTKPEQGTVIAWVPAGAGKAAFQCNVPGGKSMAVQAKGKQLTATQSKLSKDAGTMEGTTPVTDELKAGTGLVVKIPTASGELVFRALQPPPGAKAGLK
jgi:hypothetical protein